MDLQRPNLIGERTLLRAPRSSDLEERRAVGRHSAFVRLVGGDEATVTPMTDADAERWYARLCAEPYEWIIEAEGQVIGTVRLRLHDDANRRARFSIGIFDPTWWGRGIGTEATRLVLGYAFEVLRLHRVDLRVLTDNHRAIAVYEKCGFVREGVERETVYASGEWRSDLIMSILEAEYRRTTARE